MPPAAQPAEVFIAPITTGAHLLYAPLHDFSAVVNPAASRLLRQTLMGSASPDPVIQPLVGTLRQPIHVHPQVASGSLRQPYFLGIIPTRGCNLACSYCDFDPSGQDGGVMTLETVRDSVDAYLEHLHSHDIGTGEVHFFGGEPFYPRGIVEAAVTYASLRAGELGISLQFKVTTNGVFDRRICQWIADTFAVIVLSLDGPADIQDRQRPSRRGTGISQIVERNARILAAGPVELVLRACITNTTVARMEEIADWMASEFHPSTICFEPLVPSANSVAASLYPPDPWEFARHFGAVLRHLEASGIELVFSTAELQEIRASFCPLGKDALIVAPDRSISACYLLPRDWKSRGLDLQFGTLEGSHFAIDPCSLQRVRDWAGRTKPLCAGCLCQYHCAGACHVNHDTGSPAYDDLCLETRLITIHKLLLGLRQFELADHWLENSARTRNTVQQPTDILFEWEDHVI